MNMPKMFLIIAIAWIVYSMVNAASGFEKPLRKSLYNIMIGISSLVIVHYLRPYTGVDVPISTMSLTVSSVFGIPGTALILALDVFF